jgi:hypothetical protein
LRTNQREARTAAAAKLRTASILESALDAAHALGRVRQLGEILFPLRRTSGLRGGAGLLGQVGFMYRFDVTDGPIAGWRFRVLKTITC